MDAGRIIGVGVAGGAILSGLLVGSAELYKKLTQPGMKPEQGPVKTSLSKEPGDEEG
jgi:hypothetical protein